MKLLVSLLTTLSIALNSIPFNLSRQNPPRLLDAFILAYDAMYIDARAYETDYIILDMESFYFKDTTHEDREKMIEYFRKYDKTVLNASLFKLQQIGLADKLGGLKISARVLMITNIQSNDSQGIFIEGYNWGGSLAASYYRIHFKIVDNNWKIIKVELLGFS
ncbi:hypothetical protein ACN077_24720 [Clostridium chromiireducens]|uniref:hypothetical protein n=1 Tax=Clostridium chromiireducens TaxID=225345 RepID=UPI003AF7C433